jgi:hypothetical protein
MILKWEDDNGNQRPLREGATDGLMVTSPDKGEKWINVRSADTAEQRVECTRGAESDPED